MSDIPPIAIAALAEIVRAARNELIRQIAVECPGPHDFVQHRDGRRPWCPTCRYTADGVKIPPKQEP